MDHNPNSTEEALTKKLHEILVELDNEESEKFSFQEEMIEEVMQELYKEIAFSTSHVPINPPVAKNGSCEILKETSQALFGFDDWEHLDCEWVGRAFRNWWF
uniref:Uncharacterized protein n=1 Tax=Cajanus cajan TaxID=3821 RepID=A0A151TYT4_CAJCA|nr:hypothetical protein KK1_004831 [Cajanus cajan]